MASRALVAVVALALASGCAAAPDELEEDARELSARELALARIGPALDMDEAERYEDLCAKVELRETRVDRAAGLPSGARAIASDQRAAAWTAAWRTVRVSSLERALGGESIVVRAARTERAELVRETALVLSPWSLKRLAALRRTVRESELAKDSTPDEIERAVVQACEEEHPFVAACDRTERAEEEADKVAGPYLDLVRTARVLARIDAYEQGLDVREAEAAAVEIGRRARAEAVRALDERKKLEHRHDDEFRFWKDQLQVPAVYTLLKGAAEAARWVTGDSAPDPTPNLPAPVAAEGKISFAKARAAATKKKDGAKGG